MEVVAKQQESMIYELVERNKARREEKGGTYGGGEGRFTERTCK